MQVNQTGLAFGLVIREIENDCHGAGGRLALDARSWENGPVRADDVVGRAAIAPRAVGVGLHPRQKLGAAAVIDEQFHVANEDALECAAIALVFTFQDALIGDAEVVLCALRQPRLRLRNRA